MYPYLNLGPLHLPTFGLLLWLGAVAATLVLQRNFERNRIDADALNVVALVVVGGVVGAKLWHELQDPRELASSLRLIASPGWSHPGRVLLAFLAWFRDGFAWFGGLLAGIAVLMWQGSVARFRCPAWRSVDDPGPERGPRLGALRMLDLAAPAAAIGYGVGRIGCLLSGDGDYGKNTTLPWGVHMAPNALVPPNPPNALVQPTPVYELLFSLAICWLLWHLGRRARPVGWMTGLYLILSGVGRFLVEFERINPRIYLGGTLTNAQVAAVLSTIAGVVLMAAATARDVAWRPEAAAPESRSAARARSLDPAT